MIRAVSIGLLAVGFAAPVAADGFRIRTEVSGNRVWSDAGSLDAALGFSNRRSMTGSMRVMWDKTAGPFRFEIHSQLGFSQGDNVAYAAALAPFVGVPRPATFFDLTHTVHRDGDTYVTNMIDRLSVSYSSENFVLKLGRQAITWGGGMVFHPGDIVAPFAPDAIDTAYKPGADMIYGQYLFESGADIAAIYVPRAAVSGGPLDANQSTFALRTQFTIGALDSRVMLARDRGDRVASLGFSGALGGASWNVDYVGWKLANGETHPSWVMNIANFTTLGDMNVSYFGEYFHNGFGIGSGIALDSLPASLTKRMGTGQVFLTGQDFLAVGATLSLTPDFSIGPNMIISLDDGSALAGLSVDYALGDNTNLVFNYQQSIGAQGSEFGGRETSAGSGVYGGMQKTATLQLVHFF